MSLGVAPFAARPGIIFPWPGAAIDMHFGLRRYWWSGAEKLEANFTTFTLSGSTFDATLGLTPSGTQDITLALGSIATVIPGSYGVAVHHSSVAVALRSFFQMDDGTAANRIFCAQLASNGRVTCQINQASTNQSTQTPAGSETLVVRHGACHSFTTNNVLATVDGVNAGADSAATMPTTATTLRIGRATGASTQPLGSIYRLVLFTSVQVDQAAVQALSIAMRDQV